LSAAQMLVLRCLREQTSVSLAQLCKQTMTSAGSTSEVVRRLVVQGLVSRTPSARDARSVELSLTGAGHEALAGEQSGPEARVLGALENMRARDRRHLSRLLLQLAEAVESSPTVSSDLQSQGTL